MADKITNETEVSTSELACVLGITGRRIRQLAEDGQLEKTTKGRFPQCDSVQRYIASLSRETESEEDRRLDKARRTAEVTLRASKAQIAKMQADEMRGKMHRSEDVAAMTEELIYAVRGALLALPGRLAMDVSSAESTAAAADIIRSEIYKLMQEFAQHRYDPQKYAECVRNRMKWEIESEADGSDE